MVITCSKQLQKGSLGKGEGHNQQMAPNSQLPKTRGGFWYTPKKQIFSGNVSVLNVWVPKTNLNKCSFSWWWLFWILFLWPSQLKPVKATATKRKRGRVANKASSTRLHAQKLQLCELKCQLQMDMVTWSCLICIITAPCFHVGLWDGRLLSQVVERSWNTFVP